MVDDERGPCGDADVSKGVEGVSVTGLENARRL